MCFPVIPRDFAYHASDDGEQKDAVGDFVALHAKPQIMQIIEHGDSARPPRTQVKVAVKVLWRVASDGSVYPGIHGPSLLASLPRSLNPSENFFCSFMFI